MKIDDLMLDLPEDPKLFETRIVFSKERNRHETEELKRMLDENPPPQGD